MPVLNGMNINKISGNREFGFQVWMLTLTLSAIGHVTLGKAIVLLSHSQHKSTQYLIHSHRKIWMLLPVVECLTYTVLFISYKNLSSLFTNKETVAQRGYIVFLGEHRVLEEVVELGFEP